MDCSDEVLLPFLLLSRHPIVFSPSIRSPGPVTPQDVELEGFDLTYPRIARDGKVSSIAHHPQHQSSLQNDVDRKVDDAIGSFLLTLSQIGPELLSVSC